MAEKYKCWKRPGDEKPSHVRVLRRYGMRSRWERRKEIDAGQVAEEDDTFVGFNVHGTVVSEN